MSEALEAFLELQRRLWLEKEKGDGVSVTRIAELELEMRQAFENLSEAEKDSLRLQRRVTHIEGEPDDKMFAGITSVVEVFVMRRQPNGELCNTKLPGDLMIRILQALHESIKAVGEDFANQDVCRRLIADDPRVNLEDLAFEFNLSQGLLSNSR